MYTPQIASDVRTPEDIRLWVQEELRSIALALQQTESAQFQILHVEPARRVDGMVVYADGVNWNPGGGVGLYERVAGAWVQLVRADTFNEAAQDAVGTILTDTDTIDFTYLDATPSIAADVKNSSLGTVKLGGDITAAGKALLDDAAASNQRTTLGLGTAAVKNTGTSGNNIPLLDAANTFSANQILTLNGNAITKWGLNNSDGGADTAAYYEASNGTDFARIGVKGTGGSAYGAWAAGGSVIYSTFHLTLMADTATGTIKFAAGGSGLDVTLKTTGLWQWHNYTAGVILSDASGNISVSPTSAFYVHRNGTNQTGLASGVDTKIQFTHEGFDTNDNFDNVTNYRLTPTVPGYYVITLAAVLRNIDDGKQVWVSIYKNGAILAYGNSSYSSVADAFPASIAVLVVHFNGTTDYVEFHAGHDHGSARDLSGGADVTYASGIWMAP